MSDNEQEIPQPLRFGDIDVPVAEQTPLVLLLPSVIQQLKKENQGSGGWGKPGDADAKKQGLPDVQLYDLSTDFGETKNVQAEHPELS